MSTFGTVTVTTPSRQVNFKFCPAGSTRIACGFFARHTFNCNEPVGGKSERFDFQFSNSFECLHFLICHRFLITRRKTNAVAPTRFAF